MNKKLFSIAVVMMFPAVLILSGVLFAEEEKKTDTRIISVQDANELIEENKQNSKLTILDVRTIKEYQAGHIPDSVNIDYKSSNFKEQVDKLDKNKTYLTYCRSGKRSAAASELMNEIGFENIYMIEGGIVAWKKAELPIEN